MPRLITRLFPDLDFAKGELFPEVEAHCLLLLVEKVRIVVTVTRTKMIMDELMKSFLAVQDSSIGDLVTQSVSESVSESGFDFSDPRHK